MMDGLLDAQLNAALSQARPNGEPRVPAGGDARAVAEDFESFFLSQLLSAMFEGVGDENPFSGGPGERAFAGLLHEEYANVMARTGGLGLADRLTSEILRYQDNNGGLG